MQDKLETLDDDNKAIETILKRVNQSGKSNRDYYTSGPSGGSGGRGGGSG